MFSHQPVYSIMFRFITNYSSLREFGPYVIGLFWYEDFWKMIFWLVLKLEISYGGIISWRTFPFFSWYASCDWCKFWYLMVPLPPLWPFGLFVCLNFGTYPLFLFLSPFLGCFFLMTFVRVSLFWFLLEDFFENYIFAWWSRYLNFHNSSFAIRYF